ncbi:L-ascorbate oxidase homolog [Curcuma longa]|uniref:L-ascorbate oxidase homolog n=1 Tax=Curcuma longa TaxID=136217 RepID=UPI003D9F901F
MGTRSLLASFFSLLLLLASCVVGENPYRFFTWNVTYGYIWPLGVKQQVTDGLFLFGRDRRRNSWEDGVYGTNCPIPPGGNFTYVMQLKDQIGSYFYFPSLAFHKAAGGFGGIRILSRPADDYTLLIGDWFKANHTDLRYMLDSGRDLPFPDGLLINGRGQYGNTFTVEQGKTYRFRISNVGLATSLNVRIQGHTMLLVEVEGSHTLQNTYSSFDLHLGQSCSFLVTADQPPKDYLIAVSSRFISTVLSTTAVFRYSNSGGKSAGPPPGGPTMIDWSLVSSWRDENPIPRNALLCGRASGRLTRPL